MRRETMLLVGGAALVGFVLWRQAQTSKAIAQADLLSGVAGRQPITSPGANTGNNTFDSILNTLNSAAQFGTALISRSNVTKT